MASTSSGQPSTSGSTAQEFRVRVPKDVRKKYSVLKFNKANNVDFKTCGSAKMERENNLKDYKLSHGLDLAPKFGAGSEFGKDAREEARRKKYGIYLKKYNPEDQPWILKFGSGKQTRKFKGMKEGGILENASYYIFTQCPDGAFEAFPIEEWYNFTPVIKYKYLNSEEAEEEFTRRDKTMNYFNIMLKKRIRNDDEDVDTKKAASEAGKKQKKKKKDFMISDMDDWADISSDDELSESGEDKDADDDDEKPKKKKGKDKKEAKKRKAKTDDNDEAVEESDDMNEGEEVDYMSDISDDADPYVDERDKGDEPDPYDEKGMDQEGILDSDEEEENQEEKKPEEKGEDGKEIKDKEKKEGSDSESSSGSESESDPEQDTNFKSALFMLKRNEKSDKKKVLNRRSSASSEGSAATNSRSATPTVLGESDPTVKRKKGDPDAPTAKRPRLEPSSSISSDGISEEAVERYLMRKPMTTKDLLQKFKSKGLNKEKLVTTIAQILKKLNPEKTLIKDKLYLSIKK